jgi:hypothetical protein
MAAGAGYIEFATGDILTASAANSYLASQVVMVFASASARTSAITSPQEGMISYLKDTNATEYYSGSAWAAIGGGGSSGGETLLNAGGTSLTGSSVTISSIPNTYNSLKIIVRGYKPSNQDTYAKVQFNSDSGNNYMSIGTNNVGSTGFTFSTSYFQVNANGISNVSDAQYNQMFIEVPDYASSSTYKVVRSTDINKYAYANVTQDWNPEFRWGAYGSATAINSITFGISAGTWSAGTIYVYGVK